MHWPVSKLSGEFVQRVAPPVRLLAVGPVTHSAAENGRIRQNPHRMCDQRSLRILQLFGSLLRCYPVTRVQWHGTRKSSTLISGELVIGEQQTKKAFGVAWPWSLGPNLWDKRVVC